MKRETRGLASRVSEKNCFGMGECQKLGPGNLGYRDVRGR